MPQPRASALLLLLPLACTNNVDLGDLTASETSSSTAPDTDGPAITTTPASDTTHDDPTTATTTTTGDTSTTGPGDTGDTSSTDTTGDLPFDCNQPQDFLRTPEMWLPTHSSEAFAFDGKGNFATGANLGLVIVGADTNEYVLIDSDNWQGAAGMAYLPDGRLLVSQYNEVNAIDPLGFSKKWIVNSGFTSPHELQVDLAGNVWLRDGVRVVRVAPDLTQKTVYEEASDYRNTFIYDESRKVLFFTVVIRQVSHLMHMPIADDGTPGEATSIREGVGPMALDACGNLYFLLQYNNLRRLLLAPDGLTFTEQPVANTMSPGDGVTIHFGVGPGFDPYKLYANGTTGGVWTVEMEFPGAPVVVVE